MLMKVTGVAVGALLCLMIGAPAHAAIVGDREWRPVGDVTGLTWLEVNAACGATGYCDAGTGTTAPLNGWYWADLTDVQALFDSLIEPGVTNFPDVLSVYWPGDSADIAAAVQLLTPTTVVPEYQATFGWSRISGGYMLPHLFDANDTYGDYAALNYSMSANVRDSRFGVWLYRPAAVPEPEPLWMLALGLGLVTLHRVGRPSHTAVP
jgi:hypothetical protein